jgi:hypothetical protein
MVDRKIGTVTGSRNLRRHCTVTGTRQPVSPVSLATGDQAPPGHRNLSGLAGPVAGAGGRSLVLEEIDSTVPVLATVAGYVALTVTQRVKKVLTGSGDRGVPGRRSPVDLRL